MLDADRAMALVMVVTELAQNAIEHAFDPADKRGQVVIRADRSARSLEIVVHDDGRGCRRLQPGGLDRLGLQIVRTLVAPNSTVPWRCGRHPAAAPTRCCGCHRPTADRALAP